MKLPQIGFLLAWTKTDNPASFSACLEIEKADFTLTRPLFLNT